MIAEAWKAVWFDPVHWGFELFLMAIFDGLIGALLWPIIKRHIHRDIRRGPEEGV
jgi:hypothetical protein